MSMGPAGFIVINIGLVVVLVLLKGSPREPLAMKVYADLPVLLQRLKWIKVGFALRKFDLHRLRPALCSVPGRSAPATVRYADCQLVVLVSTDSAVQRPDESTFPLRATVLWVLSHAVTYVAILRPLRHSNDIARMHFRLEALMRSPAGREAFGRFLEREFCTELMEFCVGVAKFVENCNNREIMANQAASVTRSFFADGGTAVAPLDEKRIAEMTEEATQM